jgi:hypothetical protein
MGLMQFGYNPIPNPVCGKMGLIQSHLRIVGRPFAHVKRVTLQVITLKQRLRLGRGFVTLKVVWDFKGFDSKPSSSNVRAQGAVERRSARLPGVC